MVAPASSVPHRAALSAAKRVLLEKMLESAATVAIAPPIPCQPAGARVPLSCSQQSLWFFHQLDPLSPLYNVPVALRLEGVLDAVALQQSLDALVARHEILRTHFVIEDEIPAQIVGAAVAVALRQFDLPGGRGANVRALVDEECRRPFDLARDPLLRALLVRSTETDHTLVLTTHHIAFDGWSWTVFLRELAAFYAAATAGRRLALRAPPLRYGDFAVWQRGRLGGAALSGELSFWKNQLAGAPDLLALPTDRPRPPVQTFHGASEQRMLSARLTEALRALGRREGATLFMTLLAAFHVLLHRCSGQTDLVVGTAVAGRTHVQLEGVIGCFVNTLALRSDCAGDPPFRDFLRRVRAVCLDALSHQELPFDKLVEELRPARSASYSPLVQVMFTLQDDRAEPLTLPGLAITRLETTTDTAKFDLSLMVSETADGLTLILEYNRDLLDTATARRWLGHFEALLEAIVADPARHLSELPPSTTAQGSALPDSTQASPPAGQSIQGVPPTPKTNGPTRQAAVAPDDLWEEQLVHLWESLLGVSPIGVTDRFFDLGGHSLLAIRLVAQIEKAFGRRLAVATVFQAQTIRQLAAVLREDRSPPRGQALLAIQAKGARSPLYLVHGVGGGMLWGYSNLSLHLGPDQPVYVFRADRPAEENRFETIEEMAARYVQELRTFQPKGPYSLGGYCFGGNVAFEMARLLEAQGQPVALLALMNSSPPNSDYYRFQWTPVGFARFAANLVSSVADFFTWNREIRHRYVRWKLARWTRRVAGWCGWGEAAPDSGLDEIADLSALSTEEQQLYAVHLRALTHYHCRPYGGSVTLFRTRGHPLICSFDELYGWGAFARGGITLRHMPGGHDSLLQEPHVGAVARALQGGDHPTAPMAFPGSNLTSC